MIKSKRDKLNKAAIDDAVNLVLDDYIKSAKKEITKDEKEEFQRLYRIAIKGIRKMSMYLDFDYDAVILTYQSGRVEYYLENLPNSQGKTKKTKIVSVNDKIAGGDIPNHFGFSVPICY